MTVEYDNQPLGGHGALTYNEPPRDALITMIERFTKDTSIDIDKLDRLLTMRDAIVNRECEQLFNNSMADAQTGMEPVRTDLANTQTRSKYASYASIDRTIRPIYTRCGFSLSFNMGDSPTPDIVRVVCYVSHRGGFTRMYHVDVPADGRGPKGGEVMSRTHALGSAVSYGRRYLTNMIFNIAVESEDDGNGASKQQFKQEPKYERAASTSTQGPTAAMYERARVAADQGMDALRAYCKSLTKANYKEMEDYIMSLRAAAMAADANRGKHPTQTLEEEIEKSDGHIEDGDAKGNEAATG